MSKNYPVVYKKSDCSNLKTTTPKAVEVGVVPVQKCTPLLERGSEEIARPNRIVGYGADSRKKIR